MLSGILKAIAEKAKKPVPNLWGEVIFHHNQTGQPTEER
jgi:hypothetical protein